MGYELLPWWTENDIVKYYVLPNFQCFNKHILVNEYPNFKYYSMKYSKTFCFKHISIS